MKGTSFLLSFPAILLAAQSLFAQSAAEVNGSPEDLTTLHSGVEIYQKACQACHGPDGRGSSPALTGFTIPLPDFTDCSFASREQKGDWVAIAHEGGPLRSFSRLMPAFGGALSLEQLGLAVDHIQAFCESKAWPRGDFNLPRSLVTGKAYIEDEAVMTSTINTEGDGSSINKLVLERRIGVRSEFEIALPFGWQESGSTANWHGGIGDIALELKHVVYDSVDTGAIVTVAGELVLPTGNAEKGFGSDTTIFEPQLMYGQILPQDYFFQAHAGFELPYDTGKAGNEVYWNASLGRTFQEPGWGRSWTPMLEVLAAREMEAGADIAWDVVPQLQVSLSRRQHIQLNVGLRVPVTDSKQRDTQFMLYFLWDWFDGGLKEGW